MSNWGLRPSTFDGVDITAGGGVYDSWFERPNDPLGLFTREPVEVEVPSSFPVVPRTQPQSRILPIHIQMLSPTQTALNNLKKLFDPHKSNVLLRAVDGDGNTYQLTTFPVELLVTSSPGTFVARLHVAKPVWESDDENSDSQTVDTSPKTWQITNAGTVRTYPTSQLRAVAPKDHANGYRRRWPFVFASRTELPTVSTDGLLYPIDVGERGDGPGLDTATEIAAGRMQADGDDLRVLVNGVEVDRFLSGINTANTKVWCGISFQPMRRATIKAAWTIAPDSPDVGDWFEVSEPVGTLGWDNKGAFELEDECIEYDDRDARRFRVKKRGARGTTAVAHAADTTFHWVEHEIDIVFDYTAAANPPADSDRKPVISLSASSNALHSYPSPFTAPTTLRPGQFLRRFTDDNVFSAIISLQEAAGSIDFRDIAPSADAARFNGLELFVPWGIRAAAGAITHDVTVEDVLTLDVLGTDIEGYETLLETYHSINDGASKQLQPASVLSRMRYVANLHLLTGVRIVEDQDWILNTGVVIDQCQEVQLMADAVITGYMLRLKRDAAADGDIQLFIGGVGSSGDPSGQLCRMITIPAASLTLNYVDYFIIFDESALDRRRLHLAAGKYTIHAWRINHTTGTVWWPISREPTVVYPYGAFWYYAPGNWTTLTGAGRAALLGLGNGPIQPEAPTGSGYKVTLDDIIIAFDSDTPRTPKIVRGAQEIVYWLEGTLKNDNTDQELEFSRVMALGDRLLTDCEAHTVKHETPDGRLIVVGTEITDAVREANIEGDGRAFPDSSFGIWESSTNLITNGGFETNTAGWTAAGCALARDAAERKFGVASGEVITADAAANEGIYHGFAGAAGTKYTVSGWVWAAAGGTVRIVLFDDITGKQASAPVTLTTIPQRIKVRATTGGGSSTFRLYVETDVQQAITFNVDGLQAEPRGNATPYIETDGGTASRGDGRVRIPARLLDETQGWFAIRFRVGWDYDKYFGDSRALNWEVDANNRIVIARDGAGGEWTVTRISGGSVTQIAIATTFSEDDVITLIGAWTVAATRLSLDGAAFAENTAAQHIPDLSAAPHIELASILTGTSICGDVLWAAFGIGTLADADAATLHAFGNTDPGPEDFPDDANLTSLWHANQARYLHGANLPAAVPGCMTPSDLEGWLRADPGTVDLSYTEAGIGEILAKTKHRDAWA